VGEALRANLPNH